MSAARQKGTAWETAIVRYLQAEGWPHAERRALRGNHDAGDITGIPRVMVEAKTARTQELAAWLDEANTQGEAVGAEVSVVWFKRRGFTSPRDGYVLMDGTQLVQLLKQAGY